VEAKAKEEAERQRVVKEEEGKKRMREYLQRLQDKMLEEEATLLERTEGFQVMGSKCKEITTRDKEEQWPSKKARGKQPEKYCRGPQSRWGVLPPARGVCVPGRIAWYTPQGE